MVKRQRSERRKQRKPVWERSGCALIYWIDLYLCGVSLFFGGRFKIGFGRGLIFGFGFGSGSGSGTGSPALGCSVMWWGYNSISCTGRRKWGYWRPDKRISPRWGSPAGDCLFFVGCWLRLGPGLGLRFGFFFFFWGYTQVHETVTAVRWGIHGQAIVVRCGW